MDLVVTTAQIPGRAAPRLITADMVASMRPGAVIVDLAAESGGNCDLTLAGEILSPTLLTIHNLHFFLDLMAQARAAQKNRTEVIVIVSAMAIP